MFKKLVIASDALSTEKYILSNIGLIFCWIVITSIFLWANEIQANILFNRDVSWLVHVAEHLWANPTDTKNFDLPPTTLYIYTLPVIVSKIFSINIILAWRISVFAMTFISLLFCFQMLNKIFLEDKIIASLFLICLATVLLILPVYEFGQREHLLVILAYPYFCLAMLRIKNSRISFFSAFFIGLLAGIGVSFKPYFLVNIALIELYLIFRKKEYFTWWRVELIAILAVSLANILITFIYYPQIVYVFYPLLLKFYYGKDGFLNFSYNDLIWDTHFIFCYFSFCVCCIACIRKKYTDFTVMMGLAIISFIFSYLIQRAPYYYRIYPAFAQSILFLMFTFSVYLADLFSLDKTNVSRRARVSGIAILFLSGIIIFNYLWLNTWSIIRGVRNYKNNFLQNDIVKLVNQYPAPVSSYFMTSNQAMPFPLPYYTNMKISTHFFNLWWTSAIVKKEMLKLNAQQQDQLGKEKKFFIDIVASELENAKPLLVFVDTTIFSVNRISFDFIAYFSQNAAFQKSWKPYKFLGDVYNFKVYKRSSSTL